MQAGFVTVDVHGRTRAQAKVAVEAALRRCGPSVYRLRVIHGFNRGTGLRDMLHAEYGGTQPGALGAADAEFRVYECFHVGTTSIQNEKKALRAVWPGGAENML